MKTYTIGFTRKTAEDFFGTLRRAGIKRLMDVRLNNTSQLAGFAKSSDLSFFLKELCGAEYIHEPLLAPTKDVLDEYKKNKGSWEEFERRFMALMAEREIEKKLSPDIFEIPTVLLCSEDTADNCHRRLALEYLRDKWGEMEIVHL